MPSQARCPVNLIEGEDPRSHHDVVCAMSGSAHCSEVAETVGVMTRYLG